MTTDTNNSNSALWEIGDSAGGAVGGAVGGVGGGGGGGGVHTNGEQAARTDGGRSIITRIYTY